MFFQTLYIYSASFLCLILFDTTTCSFLVSHDHDQYHHPYATTITTTTTTCSTQQRWYPTDRRLRRKLGSSLLPNHSDVRVTRHAMQPKTTPPSDTTTSIEEESQSSLILSEVDVRYDTRTQLEYNPTLDRFIYTYANQHIPQEFTHLNNSSPLSSSSFIRNRQGFQHRILTILQNAFLPEGITSTSYYRYIRWRTIQRYINTIDHVIGTQSLLMVLILTH